MKKYFIIILASYFYFSCETEFVPEINNEPPEIVVEGFFEAGERASSPIVILTYSTPFFSEINVAGFDDLFVHDASVSVSDGTQKVILEELCLQDLPPDLLEVLAPEFGFDPDSLEVNICIYFDLSQSIIGESGKTYDLEIEVDDHFLTATTSIPEHTPLENPRFFDVPGIPNDTLRELRVFIQDRPGEANYYRYFTERNNEGFIAPFTSVYDDIFFDGDYFEFPVPKAEQSDAEFNIETFGYYIVGDTMTIKQCSIDEAHYRFWSTLEFNAANQGPFSAYTRVESNVNGGLGVWGAYNASYHTLVVE